MIDKLYYLIILFNFGPNVLYVIKDAMQFIYV